MRDLLLAAEELVRRRGKEGELILALVAQPAHLQWLALRDELLRTSTLISNAAARTGYEPLIDATVVLDALIESLSSGDHILLRTLANRAHEYLGDDRLAFVRQPIAAAILKRSVLELLSTHGDLRERRRQWAKGLALQIYLGWPQLFRANQGLGATEKAIDAALHNESKWDRYEQLAAAEALAREKAGKPSSSLRAQEALLKDADRLRGQRAEMIASDALAAAGMRRSNLRAVFESKRSGGTRTRKARGG